MLHNIVFCTVPVWTDLLNTAAESHNANSIFVFHTVDNIDNCLTRRIGAPVGLDMPVGT
jgi:hypothetical protein